MQRIEIVADRRRRHEPSFRALVVAECLAAETRVQDVARRHGVCPSLVYRWRRAAGVNPQSAASDFLPIRITDDATAPASEPSMSSADGAAGRSRGVIEIELPGGTRIRVDETFSLAALRRVLGALRG